MSNNVDAKKDIKIDNEYDICEGIANEDTIKLYSKYEKKDDCTELISRLSLMNINNSNNNQNKLHVFTKIKNIVNNENNDNENIENFMDKKVNYVYVIELYENRYYIGTTKTLLHRLIKHKKSKGSEITTKYKWKKLIDIIRCDNFKPTDVEDKITLEYMNKYTYNNVFGGKWTNYYRTDNEPYELKEYCKDYEKNNNNLYNRLLKEDINLINENLDNIIVKCRRRKKEVAYIYCYKQK
jgi:predicted GIY-YIG superfamily endonuclease